jgi:hypothetical protein
LAEQRQYEKLTQKKGEEFDESKVKEQDEKRKFLNTMRPPDVWNFIEKPENTIPHVLRAGAKP